MSTLDSKAKFLSGKCFLFSPGNIIFLAVLYLLLFKYPGMLLSDGSTGWHLVLGDYILKHHDIPHTDIISYTFSGKNWMCYEWLSSLIMSILVKLGGLNLLCVAAASALACLMLLLYLRCRQNGANLFFAIFLTALGALLSSSHWLARPHLFTFFGVFIFIDLLDKYYRGLISGKKLAFYLTIGTLIWANCHPGFIVGWILQVIYGVSLLIEYVFLNVDLTAKAIKQRQILTVFAVLGLCVIAGLCTPFGLHLYSYINNYLLHTNIVVAETNEFKSPIFHGAMHSVILEIFFALTIIGLSISQKKIPLPNLLIYLFFAHLSLVARRNMSLYVITVLPIISMLYTHTFF
jgi:hypothetical protein